MKISNPHNGYHKKIQSKKLKEKQNESKKLAKEKMMQNNFQKGQKKEM